MIPARGERSPEFHGARRGRKGRRREEAEREAPAAAFLSLFQELSALESDSCARFRFRDRQGRGDSAALRLPADLAGMDGHCDAPRDLRLSSPAAIDSVCFRRGASRAR